MFFQHTGDQIAPMYICRTTHIYMFLKYFFLSIIVSQTPRQQFSRYQSEILGKNII